MGWWNYPTEVVDRTSFDRLRMRGKRLRMMGRGVQSFDRLRMKVLVDEDRLED